MKEEIEKTEALEMMKLGFDELCFKFYINNPEVFASDEIFRFRGIEEDIRRKNSHFFDSKEIITAPLYQQAFRWFREKYNLYSEIDLDSYKEPYLLKITIKQLDETNSFVTNSYYPNCISGVDTFNNKQYEEAELECLKKLIQIVKDGN